MRTKLLIAPKVDVNPGAAHLHWSRQKKSMFVAIAKGDADKAYVHAVKLFHMAAHRLEYRDKRREHYDKMDPALRRLIFLKAANRRAKNRRMGIGDATGRRF